MMPMKNQVKFGDMGDDFSGWEDSGIVILPVPYDETSTWIKGADKGPFAILEASQELELYDVETCAEVYKNGIFTAAHMDVAGLPPEAMSEKVREKTAELIDAKKFVVTLGGEHSVSIGPAKAHNEKFDNMCVLQLDAHADLREEYKGSRYNHACVMARIKEMCPVVQVGVRSMSVEETEGLSTDEIFFAHDIVSSGDWINKVVDKLGLNVYVSIDLDVFDPAIMSSTGTPQPGGLGWYQVTALLKEVAQNKNVVGFDVVELCPNEYNKAPDVLAAKLVYKFLGYIFSK
jgi:agmatinase